MARPPKNTVDYFPHDTDASDGKTLTILQHKFGNDGYSFWFRLLEMLGKAPNHIIDCRNASQLEFLQAKTHLSEGSTEKILNCLADLQAIDAALWTSKLIWSQNLVDRVAEVYKNRRIEIPQKPIIPCSNTNHAIVSTADNPIPCPVSTANNPQSKLNKSKLNNKRNIIKKAYEKIYTPEEIKSCDWYNNIFLKRNPFFKDCDFKEALEWLEETPGRSLNKKFLNTWAGNMRDKLSRNKPAFIPGKLEVL